MDKKELKVIWEFIKLILVICSFFWFGWKVGLLMVVMSINLK